MNEAYEKMESYQKAKLPPPVPPKYRHSFIDSTAMTTAACQKENTFDNSYHQSSDPVTGSGALIQTNGMRVKIQINPENPVCENDYRTVLRSTSQSNGKAAVKININGTENPHLNDMLLKSASCNTCSTAVTGDNYVLPVQNGHRIYNQDQSKSNGNAKYIEFCNISSGHSSPSDNLDSGTCSDVDADTPPSFGAKKKSNSKLSVHQRSGSVNSSGIGVDSDEEDNVSCDSINSSEYNGEGEHALPIISAAILKCNAQNQLNATPAKIIEHYQTTATTDKCPNRLHQYTADKLTQLKIQDATQPYDELENTDRFLRFHLNENNFEEDKLKQNPVDDDSFAGFKSITDKNTPAATIRSAKGTVRGVKNRVRAGIATFLNNQVAKVSATYIPT